MDVVPYDAPISSIAPTFSSSPYPDRDPPESISHVMESRRLLHGEDNTQNTNSSGEISNITDLENETDEFGRKILEHARDRQRMHDVTNGTAVQAFKRARPHPRVALTLENLERNSLALDHNNVDVNKGELQRLSEPFAKHAPRRESISGSDNSNPLNVPSQWGRKGRQHNDFLKRISATTPPTKDKLPHDNHSDQDVILQRRTAFTGDSPRSDIEWIESPVDVPLAPAEHDSPLQKVLTYGAASRSSEKNGTNHYMLEEELPSVESPVAEAENRRRHSSRSRQEPLEEVVASGVTRNRMTEVGGRIPRRRQPIRQTSLPDDGVSVVTTRAVFEQLETNMEGKEGPDRSVVAVKRGKVDAQENDDHHRRQRTNHSSRDLLKQLARASSSTPSPSIHTSPKESRLPIRREHTVSPSKRAQIIEEFQTISNSTDGPLLSATKISRSLAAEMDVESSNRGIEMPALAESLVPKTPTVLGAWPKTPKVDPQRTDGERDVVSAKNSAMQSSSRDRERPDRYARPHPASAVDALLRQPDNLGDSTIASLRDLLVDSTEDLDNVSPLDDETLNLIENVKIPVHTVEEHRQKDRQAEMDTLHRMDERLKAARSGLRDASRGLKRVEQEVEDASSVVDEDEFRRSGTLPARCPNCDEITLTSLFVKAGKSFTRNFIVWDRRQGRWKFPRLTWLGLVCSIILAWWLTELTLCDYYCHQTEAYYMEGYGVHLNAPRMPYVTPTVLMKWPVQRMLDLYASAVLGQTAEQSPNPNFGKWTRHHRNTFHSFYDRDRRTKDWIFQADEFL